LRKLAYKVIHSTTIVLPAWRKILEDLQAPVTLMPRDVSTRWNSTFDMLEYAIEHWEAIDTVTQRRDLGLRKFELNDEEWAIAKQLRSVLKDATLFFSRSTPNLATVIPAMDLIDEKLTTYSCNRQYHPSIHSAVQLAKVTLNWYYQLTDQSEVYRIAMGSFFFVSVLMAHIHTYYSTTPASQARIFQECSMGGRLDHDS
ncbi:uncharacterized protein EDB93DRAFT_1087674, partial [Suillus bovinus]|uniref:uncharacterized protein n=1 Tax=Suillus bovinus TaxID=48563 RepID=UPI001B86AD2E